MSAMAAARKLAFASLAPVLIPLLIALVAVGLHAIVKLGLPVIFWYAWFASTLAMVALWLWRRHVLRVSNLESMLSVKPDPSWGSYHKTVFEEVEPFVRKLASADAAIQELPSQALGVFREVAKRIGRKGEFAEYEITIPEILLMLEKLAREYRSIFRAQVPLIDSINVSHALLLNKHKRKLESGVKWLGHAKLVYRGLRLSTPAGVISEIRDQVFGAVVDESKRNLSFSLRRGFLMDVARVSVDLYSGNFRHAIEEVPESAFYALDRQRMAESVEPIRIVLVGQVSSGKSTLVNALLDDVRAEVGILPVTDLVNVYEYVLADGVKTRVVDTPGIGSVERGQKVAIEEALAADIVIWLMRADQQAKRADQEAYQWFDDFFSREENRLRKRPAVLAVISHADRLNSYIEGQGLPPDIESSLVSYCSQYVDAAHWQVCALNGDQLGLADVKERIAGLRDEAVQTLLNRKRNDMRRSRLGITDLARFGRGVKSAVRQSLPKD